MTSTVIVNCKCCKKPFTARVADRKRGWARFCSKSCKAIKQESRTHQMRNYLQSKSRAEARPINLAMGEEDMAWGEDYCNK